MFSSVSRNYHINYIKTKREAPKSLLPAQPPPPPPIEPVQPSNSPPPLITIPETPKPQAPFFLWRFINPAK